VTGLFSIWHGDDDDDDDDDDEDDDDDDDKLQEPFKIIQPLEAVMYRNGLLNCIILKFFFC
jgi:hypothetical protein